MHGRVNFSRMVHTFPGPFFSEASPEGEAPRALASISSSGTPALRSAIRALVAASASKHNCSAFRARRCVLLLLNCAWHTAIVRRHGCGGAKQGLTLCTSGAVHDPKTSTGFAREELGTEVTEDIIHDRFRYRNFGVVRHPRRFESHMAELGDQCRQRNSVLQRQTDRRRKRVHQPADR